jgi:hypothetical protein
MVDVVTHQVFGVLNLSRLPVKCLFPYNTYVAGEPFALVLLPMNHIGGRVAIRNIKTVIPPGELAVDPFVNPDMIEAHWVISYTPV